MGFSRSKSFLQKGLALAFLPLTLFPNWVWENKGKENTQNRRRWLCWVSTWCICLPCPKSHFSLLPMHSFPHRILCVEASSSHPHPSDISHGLLSRAASSPASWLLPSQAHQSHSSQLKLTILSGSALCWVVLKGCFSSAL